MRFIVLLIITVFLLGTAPRVALAAADYGCMDRTGESGSICELDVQQLQSGNAPLRFDRIDVNGPGIVATFALGGTTVTIDREHGSCTELRGWLQTDSYYLAKSTEKIEDVDQSPLVAVLYPALDLFLYGCDITLERPLHVVLDVAYLDRIVGQIDLKTTVTNIKLYEGDPGFDRVSLTGRSAANGPISPVGSQPLRSVQVGLDVFWQALFEGAEWRDHIDSTAIEAVGARSAAVAYLLSLRSVVNPDVATWWWPMRDDADVRRWVGLAASMGDDLRANQVQASLLTEDLGLAGPRGQTPDDLAPILGSPDRARVFYESLCQMGKVHLGGLYEELPMFDYLQSRGADTLGTLAYLAEAGGLDADCGSYASAAVAGVLTGGLCEAGRPDQMPLPSEIEQSGAAFLVDNTCQGNIAFGSVQPDGNTCVASVNMHTGSPADPVVWRLTTTVRNPVCDVAHGTGQCRADVATTCQSNAESALRADMECGILLANHALRSVKVDFGVAYDEPACRWKVTSARW